MADTQNETTSMTAQDSYGFKYDEKDKRHYIERDTSDMGIDLLLGPA